MGYDTDNRGDAVAATREIGVSHADDFNLSWRNVQFLMRLTQGRRDGVFVAFVDLAAGKGDLPCMAAQPCRTLGQYDTRFRPVCDRDQHRRCAMIADTDVAFIFNFYADRGVKRRLQPVPPIHADPTRLKCTPLLQMLGLSGFSASARLAIS